MADIELVIKLPEEKYNKIIKDPFLNSEIYMAIKNGTPLADYCDSCVFYHEESEEA